MSKFLLVFLLLFFCIFSPVRALEIDWRQMEYSSFTLYLQQKAREYQETYKVPGASIALIHDGEIQNVFGLGMMNKEKRKMVTAETIFQVASLSKPVAALGVMKLVAEGLLDLMAPLSSYLNSWELPESPYAHSITPYHLLSHTGGLAPSGYPGYSPARELPTLIEALEGQGRGTLGIRMRREPGRDFFYSGGGYTLLQLLVQEVTGVSFRSYMEEEVLKSLGMSNSSFQWQEDLKEVLATPYSVFNRPLPQYRFIEEAAAGLYATAPDLAYFLLAFLDDTTFLPEYLIDQMFTPVQGGYGLGFQVIEGREGKIVAHGGGNKGYKAYMAMIPAEGSGIVILTNSDRGMPFYQDLANIFFSYYGYSYRVTVPGILSMYFFHFLQGIQSLFL